MGAGPPEGGDEPGAPPMSVLQTAPAGRRAARGLALLLALAASACTTVIGRVPAPAAVVDAAAPYGIRAESDILRAWGDAVNPERLGDVVGRRAAFIRDVHAEEIAAGRPIETVALALSGGGPDGAFGAGLVAGWTARGDRPTFNTVTGISTGAIVALFAFLGPDYDDELTEIYTTYTTNQLVTPAIFTALTGGSAVVDASGYRRLIEQYIDDEVMDRLAAAEAEGRTLLIGTTNLDASRPVVWNVTGIAATGHPAARRLVHDVIQASSAIPAAFPPVLIPVESADGRRFDEMHVDGGATQQVMLFNPSVPLRDFDAAVGAEFDRTLYVVMNNKIDKPYDPVRPRIVSIAGKAASSLLSGSGAGDIYKIYATAQRDGIDLNVVAIPEEFDMEAEEPFDPVYMRALYDLGYEYGLAGDRWSPYPPDFAP